MRNLPFDVAFTLKFKNLDPTVRNVEVCVVELTRDNMHATYDRKDPFEQKPQGCDLTGVCYCSARWERNDGIVGQVPQVVIPPLEPNRQYRFVLHATTGLPAPFRQTMIEQTARAAATFYYENLASILNPLNALTRQQELDKYTGELLTLLNDRIQEQAKSRGYSNVQPDLGTIEKRMKNDVNSGLTDISKAILALWQTGNLPSSLKFDLSGKERLETERNALNDLLNKIFNDGWSTDFLQGTYVYGVAAQALPPWTVTEAQVKNIPLRVENIKKNRKRLEDYHKEASEKIRTLEAKIKAGPSLART
ncbi:MAG: hypothetical protein IPP26_11905 [Flavobacteriales bacterium]|nr:hypothetical protein [Flavobacteriales bacterium]